jgi:hypothetical protein
MMLESPDTIKDDIVKTSIIEILCHCVCRHEKGSRSGILFLLTDEAIQIRVLQEYLREEYLADFVAEFMETLVKTFENKGFLESILK